MSNEGPLELIADEFRECLVVRCAGQSTIYFWSDLVEVRTRIPTPAGGYWEQTRLYTNKIRQDVTSAKFPRDTEEANQ